MLATIAAAMTLITVVLLWQTSTSIERAIDDYTDAAMTTTHLVNAHRETLRLEVAATHAVHDPDGSEDLGLRFAFLRRQLKVLEHFADGSRLGIEVATITNTLAELEPRLASAGHHGPERHDHEDLETLRSVERSIKALYDGEENRFLGATARSLDSKASSQRRLAILGALTLLLGSGTIVEIKWRGQRRLKESQASLDNEAAERQAAEKALRDSEERFRSLVQHSSDMMAVLDGDDRIMYWSPARHRILGHADDADVTSLDYLSFIVEDDRQRVIRAIDTANLSSPRRVQYRMFHSDGSVRAVESSVTVAPPSETGAALFVNTRDVSERAEFEQQLTHQAFHDALTGLANRALLADRITHATDRLARSEAGVAVLMIDFDDFKRINDGFGHAVGDAFLVEMARRLLESVRASDTVARLGSDEFAVVLEETDTRHAERTAHRLLHNLRRPFEVDGTSLSVTASIGVAITSLPLEDPDRLLRDADIAMYEAKRDGKAIHRFFEPEMAAEVLERLTIENGLRVALEQGQFELHYQPTMELRSGRPVGMEALIRWHHPERGLVPPDAFIPVAEECGLIVPIGRWVLETACRQVQELPPGGPELSLNVNVAPQQLTEPDFADMVLAVLDSTGFPARNLILEITERALVTDATTSLEALHQLRAHGIKVAIDDFGTGYSSLRYLHTLPVDVLKMDRSFTNGLLDTGKEPAVAQAIVQLGRALEMGIVAEGIEEADQVAALIEMQCLHGQGFYFARPMRFPDLVQFVASSFPGGDEIGWCDEAATNR